MERTLELIRRAKEGEKEAKEILMKENTGLVWSVVKRFLNRGYEAEDLFQTGCIGLIKSIEHFDLTMGVKLSTYAVPMISGEIKRFIRDDGMVKVSRTLKENAYKIKQAADQISKMTGEEAKLEDISKLTGISVDDILLALDANTEVASIYQSVYQKDGNEICLIDKIPSRKNENEISLNKILLEQLMSTLDEREKEIIHLRYFEDKTQQEIANLLGMSQVQVSRLEKKLLIHMRKMLMNEENADTP